MVESFFDFILICLASFRLTRLMVFDTITEWIRKPFHKEVIETLEDGTIETYIEIKGTGLRKFFGELLSCYWCTGFWCSVSVYVSYVFLRDIAEPVIVIFAIAACAAIIESILQRILD